MTLRLIGSEVIAGGAYHKKHDRSKFVPSPLG